MTKPIKIKLSYQVDIEIDSRGSMVAEGLNETMIDTIERAVAGRFSGNYFYDATAKVIPISTNKSKSWFAWLFRT